MIKNNFVFESFKGLCVCFPGGFSDKKMIMMTSRIGCSIKQFILLIATIKI